MLNNPPFYTAHTKSIISAFGSLFNDIQIVRTAGTAPSQVVNVPLSFSSADKAYSRKAEDPGLNYNMKRVVPRMAFNMLSFEYDIDRKIQQTQLTKYSTSPTTMATQMQPVPYNIQMELYIAVANIEDGLQIVEQILPFFNPEFVIKTKDFPTLNIVKDTPVVLNGVDYQDNTPDSDYGEARDIQWTLSFTIKTYMFGPVMGSNNIQTITIGITTGSNVVTIASTAGIKIGQLLTGTGFVVSTYVTGIINSTSFTVSTNSTATNPAATVSLNTLGNKTIQTATMTLFDMDSEQLDSTIVVTP
jgi:hypothetical protein